MPTAEELLNALLETMGDMDGDVSRARVMLYGDSGVGKTVLSMRIAQALCPSDGKILYVDFAQGFTTLSINARWRHLTKNATRMRYSGLSQLETVAQAIQAGKSPFDSFRVIVLDESSSMADGELVNVVRARAAKDPSKDPDEAKLPDMGVASTRFKNAIAMLNGCDVHIIHIAHVRKDKDKQNIEVTGPNFMPKLSSALREPMQLVGFVTADLIEGMDAAAGEADKYVRYVQVQPSRTVIAKTRIDGMPVKASFDTTVAALSEFAEGKRTEVVEVSTLINDLEENTTLTDDPAIYSE